MSNPQLIPSFVWQNWQNSTDNVPAKIIRYWSGGLIIATLTSAKRPELWIEFAPQVSAMKFDFQHKFEEIRGLDLSIANVSVDGRAFKVVSAKSSNIEYDEVFEMFADDLVEDLFKDRNLAGSIFEVEVEITKWMAFFKGNTGGTTREKMLGLLGELLFMKNWLDTDESHFRIWTGPFGSLRDFTGPNIDVEVKVLGRRAGPRTHFISSLEQLEQSETKPLILYSVRASVGENKGNSFYDLIEYLRSTPMFNQSIEGSHYFEGALERYGVGTQVPKKFSTFEIYDQEFYAVDNDFPRIPKKLISSVPQVIGVQYELDITAQKTIDLLTKKMKL